MARGLREGGPVQRLDAQRVLGRLAADDPRLSRQARGQRLRAGPGDVYDVGSAGAVGDDGVGLGVAAAADRVEVRSLRTCPFVWLVDPWWSVEARSPTAGELPEERVGAVRAQRMHEGGGADVPIGTGERAAVQVAGPA
jgi:hypothetical protein